MFQMLVDLIFYLVNTISNFIFTPIISFLEDVFPDLTDIIYNVELFLATWVFPTLKWVKMVCINCLAFPQELVSFLFGTMVILMAIYLIMLTYRCAITLYNTFKP